MSGRGGRGGARGGRGGGRGGFGGGSDKPRGGPEGVAVGTLSHDDLQKVLKKEGRDRYPADYQPKEMRKPDPAEARMCVYSRELARQLRFSPYRLTDRTTKDDMASYAEKYMQNKAFNATNLDADKLGLEKTFFPTQVWEMYFEGKDPKEAKRKKRAKKKGVDDMDDGADSEEENSDEEVMLEDQLSEEEDYGEDDYGNNYFDAGEGDDGDDGGGGGDGGEEF